MGVAVDLPLKNGPGHYIVSEGGDAYLTRDVFVVKAGSGKCVAGMVMSKDGAGLSVPWETGMTNAFILYEDIDATVNAAKRTHTVRLAEVQRAKLTFKGTPTDAVKNAAYAQLGAANIILR